MGVRPSQRPPGVPGPRTLQRERLEVIVGWGGGSVEEFLETYPQYGPVQKTDGEAGIR